MRKQLIAGAMAVALATTMTTGAMAFGGGGHGGGGGGGHGGGFGGGGFHGGGTGGFLAAAGVGAFHGGSVGAFRASRRRLALASVASTTAGAIRGSYAAIPAGAAAVAGATTGLDITRPDMASMATGTSSEDLASADSAATVITTAITATTAIMAIRPPIPDLARIINTTSPETPIAQMAAEPPPASSAGNEPGCRGPACIYDQSGSALNSYRSALRGERR